MELNQARRWWIRGERQFVDDAIQRSILCSNLYVDILIGLVEANSIHAERYVRIAC